MTADKRKKSCTTTDSLAQIQQKLHRWYQTGLGQCLLDEEKRQLAAILPTLFGYHLLQIGHFADASLLEPSKISHRVAMMLPEMDEHSAWTKPYLAGLPHSLPFASDSIDVVVLHHTLEFSPFPHEVLREVDRVLVPEGHVVMLMFNPWSMWFLQRLLLSWRKGVRVPWCGRFIGVTRSKDWLSLLGFDVMQTSGYFYRPALQQKALMDRLNWLESVGQRFWPVFGGCNIVIGKKRVETLTPIRPKWRRRGQRVVTSGLVESMDAYRRKVS